MSPPAFKKKKATKSLQQNLGLCRWLKNILWPNIIGGIWGELPSATKTKQDLPKATLKLAAFEMLDLIDNAT